MIEVSKKQAQAAADELSENISQLIKEAQNKFGNTKNVSFYIEEPDYVNGGSHPKYKVTFSANIENTILIP